MVEISSVVPLLESGSGGYISWQVRTLLVRKTMSVLVTIAQ